MLRPYHVPINFPRTMLTKITVVGAGNVGATRRLRPPHGRRE